MSLKLNLTDTQFVAIYSLLQNVRLGDRNDFESAISELAIDMEHDGAEGYVNDYLYDQGLDMPEISIEASDSDGVVINLN